MLPRHDNQRSPAADPSLGPSQTDSERAHNTTRCQALL